MLKPIGMIGKFKLKKDIIVVGLEKINQISPLFDPDLFECVDTQIYRIDMIDYRKHII